MPEQVEGDVGESDVLFELGRARDPGAELLREDQSIVTEPQCVLGDVGGCRDPAGSGQLIAELQLVDRDVAVGRDVAI